MKKILKTLLIVILVMANCYAGVVLHRQYVISPKTDSVKWEYTLLDDVTEIKSKKIENIIFNVDGNPEEIFLKKNIDLHKGDKLYVTYEGETFICSVFEYDNDTKIVCVSGAEIEDVFENFCLKIKRSPISVIAPNYKLSCSAHNDVRLAMVNEIGNSGLLLACVGMPYAPHPEPVLLLSNATSVTYDDAKDTIDVVTKGGLLGTGWRIEYESGKAYLITQNIWGEDSEPSYLGDGISNALSLGNQLGEKIKHSFSLSFDAVKKIPDEVGYESENGYHIESGMSATVNGHVEGEAEARIPILDTSVDTGNVKIDNKTYISADAGEIDCDYEVSIGDGKVKSASIKPGENNYIDPHNLGIGNKTSVSVLGEEVSSVDGKIPLTPDRDINTDVAQKRQNNVRKNLSNIWDNIKNKGKQLAKHLQEQFDVDEDDSSSIVIGDVEDYYSIYEPTIREYKDSLSAFLGGDEDVFYGYTGSSSSIDFISEINAFGNLSYTLYDIDENGIKELIIGAWDGSNFGDILHIYCIENGEVQFIGIPSKIWYDSKEDSFDGLEVIYAVEILKEGHICYASTLLDEGYRNVNGNRWILKVPLDELSKYQGMTTADIFKAKNVSTDEVVKFKDNSIHDISQFNGKVLD